jgi:hypothetical protein
VSPRHGIITDAYRFTHPTKNVNSV